MVHQNKKTYPVSKKIKWVKYDKSIKEKGIDTVTKEFEEFIDMFDKIPNPETYPKCFEFHMKLYKYYKWRKNERLQSQ